MELPGWDLELQLSIAHVYHSRPHQATGHDRDMALLAIDDELLHPEVHLAQARYDRRERKLEANRRRHLPRAAFGDDGREKEAEYSHERVGRTHSAHPLSFRYPVKHTTFQIESLPDERLSDLAGVIAQTLENEMAYQAVWDNAVQAFRQLPTEPAGVEQIVALTADLSYTSIQLGEERAFLLDVLRLNGVLSIAEPYQAVCEAFYRGHVAPLSDTLVAEFYVDCMDFLLNPRRVFETVHVEPGYAPRKIKTCEGLSTERQRMREMYITDTRGMILKGSYEDAAKRNGEFEHRYNGETCFATVRGLNTINTIVEGFVQAAGGNVYVSWQDSDDPNPCIDGRFMVNPKEVGVSVPKGADTLHIQQTNGNLHLIVRYGLPGTRYEVAIVNDGFKPYDLWPDLGAES